VNRNPDAHTPLWNRIGSDLLATAAVTSQNVIGEK
jgi:hypothetical protein